MAAFVAAPRQRRTAKWQQKPQGAAEDVLEKRAESTYAIFGRSVGHPTYMEDFYRAGGWVWRLVRRDAGWRRR